ncbi:MAG: hypothetical protein H7Y86_01720, partial [Rhizobacter sp.]|nr:hypothetical protein [Ferruginibacter sp.]
MAKKNKRIELQDIAVTDYAAEGKALAKLDGKVIFISGAVPGDTVDLLLTKNKKDWAEARVTNISIYSKERVEPFCAHFGVCGGCKWQMLPYDNQLLYKQQEAEQNLRRIGKVTDALFLPIAGADETRYYRNKLEFTFSNKEYFINPPSLPTPQGRIAEDTNEFEILSESEEANVILKETMKLSNMGVPNAPLGGGGAGPGALGYHVPRIFDKVIDIHECYLMDDVNNRIRNTVREFARANNFSFYDIRQHTGWLRNIIIRYCSTGELMVNICINYEEEANRKLLFDHLL